MRGLTRRANKGKKLLRRSHAKRHVKRRTLHGGYKYGKRVAKMAKGLRLSIRRKHSKSRSKSRKLRGGTMQSLSPSSLETNEIVGGFPYPNGGQSINTSGGYAFDFDTDGIKPITQCETE